MALNLQDHKKSQFHWLNHKNNYLFIIENGRKLKTISSNDEPGKELHCATLTEAKTCTSFSWSKDNSVLALVVNKSQIYLWEVATNNFTHFKPSLVAMGFVATNSKKNKMKEIDTILWSSVSNKLLVVYSTGQLLLVSFESSPLERFVDNNDGVLNKIAFVQRSDYLDLFVCVTTLSEILVMTFDGESKFYNQRENLNVTKVSLSSLPNSGNHEHGKHSSSIRNEFLWLSFRTVKNKIHLKRIILNPDTMTLTTNQPDIDFEEFDSTKNPLEIIDFYWLDESRFIVAFSSGFIQVVEVKYFIDNQTLKDRFELVRKEALDIRHDMESSKICSTDYDDTNSSSEQYFKAFQLRAHRNSDSTGGAIDNKSLQQDNRAFSIAVSTDFRVFYYELIESDQNSKSKHYAFERVDDLNLTGSLQKINLKLKRIEWSYDCSMLALQLSNGHILVYRTRLQNYLVVSYGSKAAYLSGIKEITILNYESETIERGKQELLTGSDQDQSQTQEASSPNGSSYNALTINVSLKPSVMAIGPKHLAIALNNRVRFYLITANVEQKMVSAEKDTDTDILPFFEEEYVSIVVALRLCSRFVAIHFDDGRLKLEAMRSQYNQYTKQTSLSDGLMSETTDLEERFFPDPAKPETISSFVLTEDLFIYSTKECTINVFCLHTWTTRQAVNHSQLFTKAIHKLISNGRGNKFVCILRESTTQPSSTNNPVTSASDNVFMYDLYSNQVIRFLEGELYQRIFDSQSSVVCEETASITLLAHAESTSQPVKPKLNKIVDAIWDTDGRTVLLIERNCVHNYIIMNHTLEESEICVEYVGTGSKASSHTTLYASQGIISFQTSLGRVINSISESYDDELNLSALKQQIQDLVREEMSNAELSRAQVKIMAMKQDYLKSAMRVYSLAKCREICEHLMSDEQFNIAPPNRAIDLVIWRQLAARALFTLNLNFALMIYRKHEMPVFARVLREIISDARSRSMDSKSSIRTRLMVLLGCDYQY